MKNKGERMKHNMMIAVVVGLMSVVSSQTADKTLKVFILAGQSNMEGHGKDSTSSPTGQWE